MSIFGYTLEDISAFYVDEKLSWDEIAVKCGKARSSVISAVKKAIGEEQYALWQKHRKEGTSVSVKSTEKPVVKEEPKQLKFIAQSVDEGILYTIFSGSEKVNYCVKTMVENKVIIDLIEKGDFAGIKEYTKPIARLNSYTVSYDAAAEKFKIADIDLPSNFQEVILRGYTDLLNGIDDSIVGIVNMVHILNKADRLDKLEQMFNFLKHNDIQILPNGMFVCYKYLEEYAGTFVDAYTHRIKQAKGDYVYTHEKGVDPNPNRVCSHGLHCCSWSYTAGRDVIAQVLVDPLDVVSIPVDYNGSKMRTKGYYIIDILRNARAPDAFNKIDEKTLNLSTFNKVFVASTGAVFQEDY